MKITKSIYNRKRMYELTFSRNDFDDLCSGCPDGGFIIGRHADVFFYIFDGINSSKSWRPMSDGYFLNIGVEAPVLLQNETSEEMDKSSQIFYDSLEKTINESGMIPIEDEINSFGKQKTINLGYVVMKVEPVLENN